MKSGIDPRVDYIFKRLFGREETAALRHDLINAVLSLPETRCVRETVLLDTAEKGSPEAKGSIFDVRARDQNGRHYNLEMQRQVLSWSFPKRLLYYWAQVHSRQMKQGDFYETLCPTYSICFLDEKLFEDGTYHHLFRVSDANGLVLCKDLEVHTIELHKFRLSAEAITTPAERWYYFLKYGAELDREKLPATLDRPVIRQALEVLMQVSQDDIEFHTYESRLKAQRDYDSLVYAATHGIEIGLEKGREEGIEKGIEKGLAIGERIGVIHLCQRALKQPLTPTVELTKLSNEDLRDLADRLQQQVLAPKNGAP